MKIITYPEKKEVIQALHGQFFKSMIKAVVDVERELLAIDAELHADLENMLLSERNSDQKDLWGVNLFLDKPKEEWIEFTALINIRPSMNNRSMEVEDPGMRAKVRAIVEKLIQE
ncbi:MAG TPA: DUF5674 family protein [bacterium]